MKLTEQVCTREQACRLRELGVLQESVFYRHIDLEDCGLMFKKRDKLRRAVYLDITNHDIYTESCVASAYTVAELGVMLPIEGGGWHKQHNGSKHCFSMSWYGYEGLFFSVDNEIEAVAKADFLIYLLENGHTTPAEVNQRLHPSTTTA